MGSSCTKSDDRFDSTDFQESKNAVTGSPHIVHVNEPTIAKIPPEYQPTIVKLPPPATKTLQQSLRGVGSRLFVKKDVRASRAASRRASNYNHVHDVAMHNFSEHGASNHGTPSGVVGLRNLGNTCFMNSSIQCLSNTIPLTDYFLGYEYRQEINRDNFLGTGGKLVIAWAELMKAMWLSNGTVVEPLTFKNSMATFAPQFSGCQQHDAQELISFLLDGIHEDLNRVQKKPYIEDKDCDGTNDEHDAIESWKNYLKRNKSLIVDLFQGQVRSTCSCRKCGYKNIRFEPFMYLSLPISNSCRSVEDCLMLYLSEEDLTGNNQWYCEKCKCHVDATKKIDLWITPPILIIHLKRFKYNESGRVGSKNNVELTYPIKSWDLCDQVRSRGGEYPLYDMYAVSNHLGGLGSGHYTAYALNRFDEKWYEFNDCSSRPIDPEKKIGKSGTPYLLFYNRASKDDESGMSGRGLLIRRQSENRPDLWPHAQVRDARFRDYTRSSVMARKVEMVQLEGI